MHEDRLPAALSGAPCYGDDAMLKVIMITGTRCFCRFINRASRPVACI